jgi:hypothetical protein
MIIYNFSVYYDISSRMRKGEQLIYLYTANIVYEQGTTRQPFASVLAKLNLFGTA